MKKFTLAALSVFLLSGATYAQQRNSASIGEKVAKKDIASDEFKHRLGSADFMQKIQQKFQHANRPTATTTRWFSQFDYYDRLSGGTMGNENLVGVRTWFDSTILQLFNTGADTVTYSAVSQVLAPASEPGTIFNDQSAYSGEMAVTSGNSYTVDSVSIAGVYTRSDSRPSNVVDTLIIGIAVHTAGDASYSRTVLTGAGLDPTPYIGTENNFYIIAPRSVNPSTLMAVSSGTPAAVVWKVPLTDADGSENIREFQFAVPETFTVPAGRRFVVTSAFKSGDTWDAYTDTLNSMHNFIYLSAEFADGGVMPYYYYRTDVKDRNGSGMMWSRPRWGYGSNYDAAPFIEMQNSADFGSEFHVISALVNCPSCAPVTVSDVDASFGSADVYPNPANNTVSVPFTLVANTNNVEVSLTNVLGQKVAAQTFAKVTANTRNIAEFNTSGLPNGVYIYTLSANGQKLTGKVVVSH